MNITLYPGDLHTIFNPCIIKTEKQTETKAKIYLAFGNWTAKPVDYITLEREYLNNEAYFDIKNILRNGISEGITPISGTPCWVDRMFFVEYTVFNDIDAKMYNATAVNAVVQVQESSALTDKRGHFMTKFDRLKYFAGYPLEIVSFAFRTGDTFIRFDGLDFTQVAANVFVIPIVDKHNSIEISNQNFDKFLRDNQGRIITDNDYEPITVPAGDDYKQFMMPIDSPDMPDNPFYIRWVNQQGGWDYWMFGYRQFASRSVSNQITFNPYVQNQELVKGFEKVVGMEAGEKIKAGSSSISENDYECVSRLIYSPYIEWFNEASGLWQSITLDGDGKNENDTNATSKDIEFTFNLPTPQLQF